MTTELSEPKAKVRRRRSSGKPDAGLVTLTTRVGTLEHELDTYKTMTEELTRQLVRLREHQTKPAEVPQNGEVDITSANLAQMDAMLGEGQPDAALELEPEVEEPTRRGTGNTKYRILGILGLVLFVVAGFLIFMVATGRLG